MTSKNVVTLKSRSEVTQGHWKGFYSIDWYGFLLVFYSNFVPKMYRFWDIWLQKMLWPWNSGQRSLNVIGTDTDQYATYGSY